MITFTELLEKAKNKKIAVHTPTEEQAITLLTELDKKGYKWLGGDKITSRTWYGEYKEKTCYVFGIHAIGSLLNKRVVFGLLKFHQNEGYAIIEFEDIDFKEK